MVEELGHDRRLAKLAQHPEVLGHPLHARRFEVPVGHHREVRFDGPEVQLILRRGVQPIGELFPARLRHAAAGQAGKGPRVELVEDARLPGREDAGADGAHVRVGEEVEHAQSLRLADDGGEVGDRLRVVDVAPLGDVRHREVVRHEKFDRLAVGRRESQARRQLADERDPLRHVAVPPRLADVVEQHAEHQKLGLLDLAEDARGALRLRGLTGRQRLEVLDGEQRVLVRGELMVDIVLHQARERAELRQIAAEELQLVHLGKRLSRASPVPADVEEELAHRVRPPERVVDQVKRVLDGTLEVERQLATQSVQVPEDLHEPRGVPAKMRGVTVGEVEPSVEEHEPVRERLLPLASLGGAAT